MSPPVCYMATHCHTTESKFVDLNYVLLDCVAMTLIVIRLFMWKYHDRQACEVVDDFE